MVLKVEIESIKLKISDELSEMIEKIKNLLRKMYIVLL